MNREEFEMAMRVFMIVLLLVASSVPSEDLTIKGSLIKEI